MSGAIRLAFTKVLALEPDRWFTPGDVRIQKAELDRLVDLGVLKIRRDLPTASSLCLWRYKVKR